MGKIYTTASLATAKKKFGTCVGYYNVGYSLHVRYTQRNNITVLNVMHSRWFGDVGAQVVETPLGFAYRYIESGGYSDLRIFSSQTRAYAYFAKIVAKHAQKS